MHTVKWAAAMGLAALVGFSAKPVRADTIVAKFDSVAHGGVAATLNLNDHAGHSTTVSGYVGEYLWTQTGGTPTLGSAGSFATFCVEITQDINFGGSYGYDLIPVGSAPRPSSYWTPVGGMGGTDATEICQLWAAHINDVTTADTAAAFQFAVWQIIYGNELTITPYQTSQQSEFTTDIALADSWRTGLSGAGANLIALSSNYTDSPNPNSQDQITVSPYPTPSPTPVPLPATANAGLALLAGAGLILSFRFRRSDRAVAQGLR
jgi:hypothetical protein